MENASKAFYMAGGVLIALLLVGVLLYAFNAMKETPQKQEDIKKAEQLKNFNLEYESYDRKRMYGADVVSVLNKAIDNNTRKEEENYINIEVQFTENVAQFSAGKIYSLQNNNSSIQTFLNELRAGNTFDGFTTRVFSCQKVQYSKQGQINYMKFIQQVIEL